MSARTRAALAVVTGAAVAVTGLAVIAPNAAIADSAAPTTLTAFADLQPVAAVSKVFVSSGTGSNGVLVTNWSGTTLTTVGGTPGASGLDQNADGTKVFVALSNGDGIAAIDTTTYAVTTYPTGSSTCPSSVAVNGPQVWFGYGCGSAHGGLGVLDLSGENPVVSLNKDTNSWYYGPTLDSANGVLVAALRGISPATVVTYALSGTTATQLAKNSSNMGSNLGGVAISPDGQNVVVGSGSPYYHPVFTTSALSANGVYPGTTYPNGAAISPDGQHVATGTNGIYDIDVRIFATGGSTPQRTVDFGTASGCATDLPPNGLAWGDNQTLFAVSYDSYEENQVTLNVFSPTGPNLAANGACAAPSPPVTVTATTTKTATATATATTTKTATATATATQTVTATPTVTVTATPTVTVTATPTPAPGSNDRTAPTVRLTGPAATSTTTDSTRVSWWAADKESGPASFDVRYRSASRSKDWGAHTTLLAASTLTATTVKLAPGVDYCFSVRGRDTAGNVSDWTGERCITRALDDRSLRKGKNVKRISDSGAMADTLSRTTKSGAALSLTNVTANRIGVVVKKCPSCGTVKVWFDGKLLGTLSTKSSKSRSQVIVWFSVNDVRHGTVRLEQKGKKSVRIDGLLTSRRANGR